MAVYRMLVRKKGTNDKFLGILGVEANDKLVLGGNVLHQVVFWSKEELADGILELETNFPSYEHKIVEG